jgi:hypothetical protein
MSQLDDAVSRYNKSLETGPLSDLAWAEALHSRMEGSKLSAGGRLICPFLRPNFISRRQYDSLVKTGESLISAIDRMEQMVLASPALLARLELLPAEKMLAAIDPGYQALEVAARLDSHLVNGHLHFVQYNADSPTGAGYADALAELFWEIPPVKELRKKYSLARVGSRKHLLQALLKSAAPSGPISRLSSSGTITPRAKASMNSSAISSATKVTWWKLFPLSNWNIVTESCVRVRSKSIWCTAAWACRNS